MLKVRIDNAVKNIAVYLILGIKLDGTKEILGIYISKDSESSIFSYIYLVRLKIVV